MFKKYAIIALLILAVVALAAVGVVMVERVRHGQPRQQGGQSLPAPQPFAEQVVIADFMQACGEKDRCIVVDTTCSFCCKYVAINAAQEALFNKMFDQNCSQYTGASCECFDLSSYPRCVNGKCQLVKWDDEGG